MLENSYEGEYLELGVKEIQTDRENYQREKL
jgi:hypothetical protein